MNYLNNKSIYHEIYEILENRSFIQDIDIVYHYTTLDSLYKILISKSFHCCHRSFTNDYSEFEYGINMLDNSINRLTNNSEDVAPLGEMFSKIKNPKFVKAFIGSFTTLKDSLSQWRSYAANATGIAVGFDVKKLANYCEKNELFFGSVFYSDDSDKLFVKLMKKLSPLFNEMINNGKEEDIHNGYAIFFSYILGMASFIKHNGYKEESEIRIISGNSSSLYHKFHRGLYVPFAQLDLSKEITDLIKEIWVGPAANQELVRRSVDLMLLENGFSDKCKVGLSKIPFRLLS